MKKLLALYGVIVLYFILLFCVLIPNNYGAYNLIINPIIWFIIGLIAILLAKDNKIRYKNLRDNTQSLIIVLIIYIIFYFIIGLVIGYQKTPYSRELIGILKNIWSFGIIIFLQEIVRNAFVRLGKKNKINYLIVTMIFVFVQINYWTIASNFTGIEPIFKYVSTVFIPLIIVNGVLTYLAYIGGTRLTIIYRLFLELPVYIVPIVPNMDWFIQAVVGATVPIVVLIYINYVYVNKTERLSKRDKKKNSPISYIPIIFIITILVVFVAGGFKYQPIAIMSGSMHPYFNRGDAVVVKKLTTEEKTKLKVKDIIQYQSGSKYIIHRIVKVSNDAEGNMTFITKGDFNNTEDIEPVTFEQIKGSVSFIIPYIGFPSVWLSDITK